MLEKYKPYMIIVFVFGIIVFIFFSYLYFEKEDDDFYLAEDITTTKEELDDFFVDVKGAVNNPGVYQFKNGDRVINAIERAEGLTKNADTSNINLSKRLASEMVVYVYTKNEIRAGIKSLDCSTSCDCEVVEVNNCYPSPEGNKINLNTASEEDLQKLNGIGAAKAKDIVNYRNTNGNFKRIEDLLNVSGIGDALFQKIKGDVTI